MQSRRVGWTLVVLALTTGFARGQWPESARQPPSAPRAAEPSAPAPIIMRQKAFSVPFTVNPSAPAPTEIQLHVSTDRGGSWQLYDRAAPAAGKFGFRANADGEYWFALRTMESDGRANPPGPTFRPGMRIIIDSVEPQLQFDATVGPSGEVKTAWRASDPTLDPATLTIEYQPTLGGPWQPIAVDRRADAGASGILAGELTWWPETSSRVIHVRAEVADKANNKAVVMQRVFLPRVVAGGGNAAGTGGSPNAEPTTTRSPDGITWQADSRDGASGSPRIHASRQDLHSQWVSAGTGQAAETGALGSGGPSGAAGLPAATASSTRRPIDNPYVSGTQPFSELGSYPAVEGQTQPRVTRQVTTGESPPTAPPRDAATGLPIGERPRMTNSKRFQLEYDLDAVGPSGVAEVQLWGTSDNGQTWSHWQSDADKQSPLDVSVPTEGVFGFRVVVVGNNGLSSKPPQNGELADLWIGVDCTPPRVRLTSAIYGEGQHAGQLDIRWEAADDWLVDRPVTLQFSEQPQGPWSTIASGIPNTGQYYWPVEARIPEKIFLRIEVLDEAGNKGEYQLNEAVSTTGLVPQGRIRGFRSARSYWPQFTDIQ